VALPIRRVRKTDRPAAVDDRPHVVVLGGGFAGISAVRDLADLPVRVTLVDQNPYSTFQPLLYQVATGGLNPGDIIYPLRSLTARTGNARTARGRVIDLDTGTRQVTLTNPKVHETRTLTYDYLIVATGATTNFFGVPGAEENALPLYTRVDALKARDRVFGTLEQASAADPKPESLRFVVVGGGATGVEMAGALAELRQAESAAFPELADVEMHVLLVEQVDHLLTAFVPKLRDYALRQLRARGVEVRLNTSVKAVHPDGVTVGEGDEAEELEANVVIWATGLKTDPVMDSWGLPRGRGGRIVVGPDQQVDGQPGVFAAGDVAVSKDPDHALPQLAQPAIQTGKHAVAQIGHLLRGEPTEAFSYRDKGTMATIGRRAAVADIAHGPRLTGTLAWLAWLGLHLVTLLGGRNRASALVNMAARYAAWPRGLNPIIGD
jgi:NADH dehydrogenase